MSVSRAYVDTSVIAAIALNEVGSNDHARRLENFSQLISSNLLEAAPEPGEIAFVTLDNRQRSIAVALGFRA